MEETQIRTLIFFSCYVLLCVGEIVFAKVKQAPKRKWARWPANVGLVIINTLCLRLILPMGAVGVSVWGQSEGIGLFHYIEWPFFLSLLVSVLLMDLAIYIQHVVTHKVPWLWRLHRVHHSDQYLDVSSGGRFHPIEILLSMLYKVMLILLLGLSAEAVLVFETLLSSLALFNHANLAIPWFLEKGLRLFVITPDVHRIHHSLKLEESNKNFGFNLSIWDRIFGTFQDHPKNPELPLGVKEVSLETSQGFWNLLKQPFY